MRNVTLLILFTISCLGAIAQPELDNWVPNSTGLAQYDDGSTVTTLADSANVLQVCYDANDVYVRCEGLAEYTMGPFTANPNTPSGQDYIFVLPRNPTPATNNLSVTGGTSGVGVNGVPFFGYGDGRSYDSGTNTNINAGDGLWNQDAWISEGQTMDANGNGHPASGGVYHHHANPIQLYSDPSTGHSPIIGFALDGYPIYGPFGYASAMDSTSGIVRIQSSYQLRNITVRTILPDGSASSPAGPAVSNAFPIGTYIEDYEYLVGTGDLDEYNGRDCVTPEYPGGTYAYFLSTDSVGDPKFPYIFASEYYGDISLQNFGPNVGNGTIPGGASCVVFSCSVGVTATSTTVSCANGIDGSVTASASSGTAPYSYLWSTGDSSATDWDLGAGTYTVTVTDGTGCTGTAMTVVTEPMPISGSVVTVDETSWGACDGSASIAPAGGTAPFSYFWSNAATTATATGLCDGQYCVTVTDDYGCTYSACGTLAACNLTLSTIGLDPYCSNTMDGAVSVTASNGTSPYTYAWSSGGSSATLSGLGAGTYTVTVTDAAGCEEIETQTISAPIALVLGLTGSDPTAMNACDGSANASASGGASMYTYLWSNGVTTPGNTGLCAGQYCVTLSDANGCSASNCVTLTDPNNCMLTATATATNSPCNGASDGTATATPANGAMPFTFGWSNGTTTPMANNLAAGMYTVTVTDDDGCTATASVTITELPPFSVTIAATDETQPGANDGTVVATPAGGQMPFTFLWSNGASASILVDLAPSTYSLTLTDGSGCTATASAQVAPGSVGIGTATAADVLAVFPNPASEQLNIQFAQADRYEVRLINALGKVMVSEVIASKTATLPVHELPAGLYLLQVMHQQRGITTRSIVIE